MPVALSVVIMQCVRIVSWTLGREVANDSAARDDLVLGFADYQPTGLLVSGTIRASVLVVSGARMDMAAWGG